MSLGQKGSNFKYGLEIGDKTLHSNISLINSFEVYYITLSPAQVAANTTAEQTFNVPNLGANDIILSIIKPTAQAGLGIVQYRVSAANTLAITFMNDTAAPITPTTSEVYKLVTIS